MAYTTDMFAAMNVTVVQPAPPAPSSIAAVLTSSGNLQLIPTQFREKILVEKWLPVVVFPTFRT